MSVPSISKMNTSFPLAFDSLQGSVFHDKTNGLVKIIFNRELSNQHLKPIFEVTVNDKILISPTIAEPTHENRSIFCNSLGFTATLMNHYIIITEKNSHFTSIYYVDLDERIGEIAYRVLTEIPTELNGK